MSTLVAVCGLPGTGKTTVAEGIAGRLDAVLFRSDVVRKELFDDLDYSEAETEQVYAALFDRATGALGDGAVVLDATFRTGGYRADARAVAEERGAAFRLVTVECDESVVRERIRARTDDASDADVAVYEELRAEYESVEDPDLVVDNSGPLSETLDRLDAVF